MAKFLCQRGLADRLIDFSDKAVRPYRIWLEREPDNRYDPRAIKVCVSQVDMFTKSPTMQTDDQTEIVLLCLGYIPKDLAYNLSQILDNTHVFTVPQVSYH